VLGGRGYDQDLLRRLRLGNLLLFGQEINQFIGETLAGGDVLGDQDGDRLDHPVFDCPVLDVIIVNLLKLFILASRGVLRHIADRFDKLRLNSIPQRKPMDDIGEIVVSDIAGARNIHDEFEPVFRLKQKLLPFFERRIGRAHQVVSLIIQYQRPLAFPCQAVLDGGLGVDISGMDVLNADAPLLNSVGSVDNAGVGNLRISRQKVFEGPIGGEGPKLLRQTCFNGVRGTQD